jgi:membrane protein
MVDRLVHFLTHRIWRIRLGEQPLRQRVFLRPVRVLLLSFRGFQEDRIQIRASALTFYTLLSVVPVMAVTLGIAKGFGLDEALEVALRENLQGQDEILEQIITYSNRLLAETRGGVVAGVGVAFLFWAVIRLLRTIELSFNDIWGIHKARNLSRRTLDYLALMLIAPVLLTISGTLTALLSGGASRILAYVPVLDPASGGALVGRVLPFVAVTALFWLLYRFMPNTGVTLKASAFGALVAGVVYQITQSGYFLFQRFLSGYNAVYGTLTALPLFLIWLQLSWLVILFGAEISFAVDNEETYALERDWSGVSQRFRRLLALRFVESIARRFEQEEEPASAAELSHELAIPVRLVRKVLFDLVTAGLVVEFQAPGVAESRFQPARPTEGLTVQAVLEALEHAGREPDLTLRDEEFVLLTEKLRRFDDMVSSSPENVPLSDLREG